MRGTTNSPAGTSQAALTANSQKRAGLVAVDSSDIVAVLDRFGREISL
jgi:hypothetical protein